MSTTSIEPSVLCRHDLLPVEVVAIEAPGPGALQRWNSDDLELLHVIAACEESARDVREEHGPVAAELARIDARLRLALRLLGRLAAPALPPAREVSLGTGRLEWRSDGPGGLDDWVLASVWLSPQVPEPLRLPGRRVAASDATGGWAALRYEGLAGPVEDALAKHVFLHHRRSVALARPAQDGR
ncbi:MAG: PilZ domain-containing protein [Steroidobacteraceae bacterium]